MQIIVPCIGMKIGERGDYGLELHMLELHMDPKIRVEILFQKRTTGTAAHDIASPLIRFEYVTSANEQGYSRFETYVQIANMSATCSLAFNLSKYLCIGVIGHYNFSYVENIELYERIIYFPDYSIPILTG